MSTKVTIWLERTESDQSNDDPRLDTMTVGDGELEWSWRDVVRFTDFLAKGLSELGELGRVFVTDNATYQTLYAVINEPAWWDQDAYDDLYADWDDMRQPITRPLRDIIDLEANYVREFKSNYMDFLTNAFDLEAV